MSAPQPDSTHQPMGDAFVLATAAVVQRHDVDPAVMAAVFNATVEALRDLHLLAPAAARPPVRTPPPPPSLNELDLWAQMLAEASQHVRYTGPDWVQLRRSQALIEHAYREALAHGAAPEVFAPLRKALLAAAPEHSG